MTSTPVAREPGAFRRFYASFGGRSGLKREGRAEQLYCALLDATFDVEKAAANRRRASLTIDGTPVVYSFQLGASTGRPVFRVLCEPGGLAISVPEQVEFSRRVLRGLTERFGWRTAQAELDKVLSRAIPGDPSAMSDWWGGLWIGAAMQDDIAEIRVYANLRHGDYVSRWQRVADVLAPFADHRLAPAVREWMDTAGRVAIPVGVGVVLTGGGVPVVRVYLGVETPSMEAIRTARGKRFGASDALLSDFCDGFEQLYGPFRRQSMTLGYDFSRDTDGLFRPEISRFKVDIAFGHIVPAASASCDAFVEAWADREFAAGSMSYRQFRRDLDECFGGSTIEYVSLATRGERLSGMTVYARPRPRRD